MGVWLVQPEEDLASQGPSKACGGVIKTADPRSSWCMLRDYRLKGNGEEETGYKEKLFPHQDSQAVVQVGQSGCTISLGGFQNPEQPGLMLL